MNQRILVITSDNGGDREDGNVYYSRYALITATGSLDFKEREFRNLSGITEGDENTVIANLRAYGYQIDTLPPVFVHYRSYED